MVGILKNALTQEEIPAEEPEDISAFRQRVYKNTQLNAQLLSSKKSAQKKDVIPKDTLSLKHEHDAEERLQWNQKNLSENEIAKKQFQDIHVDEPKTPYQGAVDPSGEYYKIDDEDDDEEGLDSLNLGEPQMDLQPSTTEETEEPKELSKEERHRLFEEKRKKHYNIKEALKNKPADDQEE